MKKFLVVSLMFVIATVSYFYWESVSDVSATGQPVTYRCVLKPTNGVWAILDDTNHANEGCTGISQDSTKIMVTYPTMSRVTGNKTQIDDILAKADIVAGASEGFSMASIYFKNSINPSTITNNSAAIFFEANGLD